MIKDWCIYILNYENGTERVVVDHFSKLEAIERVVYYGEHARYGLRKYHVEEV